jgi:hypothetical protein
MIAYAPDLAITCSHPLQATLQHREHVPRRYNMDGASMRSAYINPSAAMALAVVRMGQACIAEILEYNPRGSSIGSRRNSPTSVL